jgi:hypothetical protein
MIEVRVREPTEIQSSILRAAKGSGDEATDTLFGSGKIVVFTAFFDEIVRVDERKDCQFPSRGEPSGPHGDYTGLSCRQGFHHGGLVQAATATPRISGIKTNDNLANGLLAIVADGDREFCFGTGEGYRRDGFDREVWSGDGCFDGLDAHIVILSTFSFTTEIGITLCVDDDLDSIGQPVRVLSIGGGVVCDAQANFVASFEGDADGLSQRDTIWIEQSGSRFGIPVALECDNDPGPNA